MHFSLSDATREDLNDLAELLDQPVAELIHGLVFNALQEPSFREMILEGKRRRAERAVRAAELVELLKPLAPQAH